MEIEEVLKKIKELINVSYTCDNQMPNVVILGKKIYDNLNSYNQVMISNYVSADTSMEIDIVIDYNNVDAIKVGYIFE